VIYLKALILAVALAMPLGARASGAPISEVWLIPLFILGGIAALIDEAFSSDPASPPEPVAEQPEPAASEPERPSMPAAGESS